MKWLNTVSEHYEFPERLREFVIKRIFSGFFCCGGLKISQMSVQPRKQVVNKVFREKADHHNLQKQTPMKYPCLPETLVSTLGWSLLEIRITKPRK